MRKKRGKGKGSLWDEDIHKAGPRLNPLSLSATGLTGQMRKGQYIGLR